MAPCCRGPGAAPWLAAALLAGCPADPAFVAGDTFVDTGNVLDDADTATDTGAATDVTTLDGDDVTDGDVDATDTNRTTGADVEVVLGPACPPPCGPAASCVDDHCACDELDCAMSVSATPIDDVALALTAGNTPAVAYIRADGAAEVALSRWSESGWSHDATIAFSQGMPIGVAAMPSGRLVLLARGEVGNAALHWEPSASGNWIQSDTFQSTCRHGALLYEPAREVMVAACVDTTTAQLRLSLQASDDQPLESLPPLSVGKPGNTHLVRVSTGLNGDVWVVYSQSKSPDATMHVRRFDSQWREEELGAFVPPPSAAAAPPLDIALDGLDDVHVVYLRDVSDETVVTHRIRVDTDNWATHDIPLAELDGVTRIDLEPGVANEVQLLVVRSRSLEWMRLSAGDVVARRTLDLPAGVSAADLVTDAHGKPWVAYGRGLVEVGLWRPDGP